MMATDFVGRLEEAAIAAQRAEIAFRRDIAAEIERHERERQFAFRRLDLARSMAKAAAGAQTEEAAIAAQVAALRSEFGWHGESEERRRIVEAWRNVASAIATSIPRGDSDATEAREDGPERDAGGDAEAVPVAMLAFEAWYEREFGGPFLALMDLEIPEMPVVEF